MGFSVAQMVKDPPAMQETWAWSLGGEDPLEKGMATHSSILVWEIPRTEESGELQSMGLQRVGQGRANKWERAWQTSSHDPRELALHAQLGFAVFQLNVNNLAEHHHQTRSLCDHTGSRQKQDHDHIWTLQNMSTIQAPKYSSLCLLVNRSDLCFFITCSFGLHLVSFLLDEAYWDTPSWTHHCFLIAHHPNQCPHFPGLSPKLPSQSPNPTLGSS